jgi:hypothetical protein
VRALLRAGLFYTWWYPSRWFGWGRWPRYAEFGPLATHVRFVERSSRRLARTIFHCMVRFGPGLEKRQAVLGRLVDVGAELLAITAACSRALALVRKDPADRTPLELADVFARQARRRVRERFHAVRANDDVATYAVARGALDGRYAWLEDGIVRDGPPS